MGKEDWWYERELDVPAQLLAEDIVYLSCDSLDTIAEIFLNGKKAGSADNMFVRWRFDAKPFLRPGKNSIRIVFSSAEKAAFAAAKKLPYPVPHNRFPVQSLHRNLIRKVQCHPAGTGVPASWWRGSAVTSPLGHSPTSASTTCSRSRSTRAGSASCT